MLSFHQLIHQETVKFTLFNCVPLISKAGRADRRFSFCLEPININSIFCHVESQFIGNEP